MQIYINDSSLRLNSKIKEYINSQVLEMQKFMDNPSAIRINVNKEHIHFTCEIILHESYSKHDTTIKSVKKGTIPMMVIKQALSSMRKQLKRRHEKVHNKLHANHHKKIFKIKEYTINKVFEIENIDDENFEYDLDDESDLPIKFCSTKDALMYMEMENSSYYIFVNIESETMSVIQKLPNGQLKIVDTHQKVV
ncbi:HPF/RaiA family ribosome-associated protein [Anaplasmataceae bacterium AB001_6]|nr:HPF/RaiA family ribosome-associated protein [Anaplasmataceae bacterium AB001_6]